jgi:F-type H+-transporting ATPase subunit gamma
MKAMAASNIVQYELAVSSLEEYYRTVALGVIAYLKEEAIGVMVEKAGLEKNDPKLICAIVFGSDQGLVAQFNDLVADAVSRSLHAMPGEKEVWAVGERVQLLLSDAGYAATCLFQVPNSVDAITPLVEQILIKCEESYNKGNVKEVYIFHNQSNTGSGYQPVIQRLLPFDEKWRHKFAELHWPTKIMPQVAGGIKPTLFALIREYLFVSLFKACAESLASENESRLGAMQRAEKNIEGLLDDLGRTFHRLRQSTIDEELFDVIAGFEALKEPFQR